MKTTAATVLASLVSGVLLADQVSAAAPTRTLRADAVTQFPAEASVENAALADLIKAQTEAIKALEARIVQPEARVKLESPW
jgi:hypothetical protein